MINLHKKMFPTQLGLNLQPPDHQSDVLPTATEAGFGNLCPTISHLIWYQSFLLGKLIIQMGARITDLWVIYPINFIWIAFPEILFW